MKISLRLMASVMLAVIAVWSIPAPTNADVVAITSRAALHGTDFFDWASIGSATTYIDSPFSIQASSTPVTATVSQPYFPFFARVDQNSSSGFWDNSWDGNFAPNEALIWNYNTIWNESTWRPDTDRDSMSTITIDFSSPVKGVGTQIQKDAWGEFEVQLDVYAVDDTTLLGSFTEKGFSSSDADDSAIFLGALSSSAEIGRVDYKADYGFAINRVSLTPIPEPTTLFLFGSGLTCLAIFRKEFKKS